MLPAFFMCQYEDKNGNAKKKPKVPHQYTPKGILVLTLKGKLV